MAVIVAGGTTAGANVTLTQVSSDPFTNSTSQHATELEPDTFANGSTVIGTFQVAGSSTAARPASVSRGPPTAASRGPTPSCPI